MDIFHEVSEDTPFLPPYSVHRFALWSFLLGWEHTGDGAGEAVQVELSVRPAGQSVGPAGAGGLTDICASGADS